MSLLRIFHGVEWRESYQQQQTEVKLPKPSYLAMSSQVLEAVLPKLALNADKDKLSAAGRVRSLPLAHDHYNRITKSTFNLTTSNRTS